MSMILDSYRFGGGGGGGDPYFSSVVSLLHFDGADGSTVFTDVTGKVWTAGGGSELDTSNPKFGTAAGLFNGSNSLIYTPDHADFHFGSGDFTVEMWIDPSVLSGYGTLFAKWDGGSGGRSFILYHNGTGLEFYFSTTGSDSVLALSAAGALSTSGGYVHLVIVRDGATLRAYVGGVQVATYAVGTTAFAPGTGSPFCYSGQTPAAFGWYNGLSDEARVTKGVCRYPGGTTFTPPAAEFPDS